MKFSACSRTGFALALTAALAGVAPSAMAEEQGSSIFANVSPSLRDRVFFRLNYIYANIKTTSGATRDVTGPVLTYQDLVTYLAPGNRSGAANGMGQAAMPLVGSSADEYKSPYYPTTSVGTSFRQNKIYDPTNASGVTNQLKTAIDNDVALGFTWEANGLGTPDGVKAKSQESVATPAISVGYYLTDDYTWFVEGYLLASPLKVTVKGDGINAQGVPYGISGKDIITTKLLPPVAVLGYYFGSAQSAIRPFVGVGGSYAMFFDVRATDTLNEYVGGRSSGDTTVAIKNAFGAGPFVGLRSSFSDTWSFNVSIGKLRYKTEATVTTRNTTITDSSAIIKEYGPYVSNLNTNGAEVIKEGLAVNNLGNPSAVGLASGAYQQGVVTALMCDLAATKYHNNDCNLGTFVRKQDTVMDNTMFMFSVGRTF